MLQRQSAALFLDPGSGKTSITYAALATLKSEGMLHGALVVAPLRPATQVWPAEQREWIEFHGLDVAVLHGKHKADLVAEKHDVYVINYEGLAWLVNGGYLQNLLRRKWVDTLVFDELSKMKNASKKAERRKLLVPLLPKFARRWGLTGSPASNGLINLFGQAGILDLGAAFGPYITHFRTRYFNPVGEWGWVIKAGAEELIYEALRNLALRMPPTKSVKLPTIKPNIIKVTLPPAARVAYDTMEDEMLAVLDNTLVAAGSASAVYGKCWQIASGAVFKATIDPVTGEPIARTGTAREWHNIHDEKLDALEELLDEVQGQQVLVAYWFKHDLEKLLARFGKDTPYIGAGVSVKRALAHEAAWNAGELPMLIGHPSSMGHGLNLQKSSARHVVWFTVTPDYELYDQFNRRICRRGNTAKVVHVHHIVADRTVDTWGILPSLRRKHRVQDNLFEALRELSADTPRRSGLPKARK